MAQIIDQMGHEYEALIADQDAVVVDPLTGTNRKLFAGQPIPGGLEDAYRVVVAEAAPKRKTRRKDTDD